MLLKNLDVRYLIFETEVGDSGTPHLQGYVYLHKKKSLSAANKFFGLPMHVEVAKADSFCNLEYCTKENGEIFEKGDRPLAQTEKGKKGKQFYEDVIQCCERGDLAKIRKDAPAMYFEKIKLLEYHRTRAAVKPGELSKLDNHWIWGKTKTGKTLSVKTKYWGKNIYWKDPHNKWWDGYQGEEIVVLDDLDAKKALDYAGEFLKRWCGHEPFLAESKGGNTRYIRPTTFVVTCNWSPEEIWKSEQLLEPIQRRFKVKHIVGARDMNHLIHKYKMKAICHDIVSHIRNPQAATRVYR